MAKKYITLYKILPWWKNNPEPIFKIKQMMHNKQSIVAYGNKWHYNEKKNENENVCLIQALP